MIATPFQTRFHAAMDERHQMFAYAFGGAGDSVVFECDAERHAVSLIVDCAELEARIDVVRRNGDADNVMAMVAFKTRGGAETSWYRDLARKVDNGYVSGTCFNYFDVVDYDSDESWGVLAAIEIIVRSVLEFKMAVLEMKAAARVFLIGVGGTQGAIPAHMAQGIFDLTYGSNNDVVSRAIQYYYDKCDRVVARRLF